MDKILYETTGTCSRAIQVVVENNIIKEIEFFGGCMGNLNGIASLCKGMDVNAVIQKLNGIKCGAKDTSCPDQLANCLIQYLKEQASKASIKAE